MPFKTKRQKLSSQEKKYSILESGLAVYKSTENLKLVETKENTRETKRENYNYLKSDLIKISLLATFIFVTQLMLKYFFASKISFSFIS